MTSAVQVDESTVNVHGSEQKNNKNTTASAQRPGNIQLASTVALHCIQNL